MIKTGKFIFLSMITFASAQASQMLQHDLENHLTKFGPAVIPHAASVVEKIPEGTVIYFNPAMKQLCLRPKGLLIKYTCPAVQGIPGLEIDRPMGVCPQYLPINDGTQIQYLDYSAPFDIPDGLYKSVGIKTLSSKVEDGVRKNTNQLECVTGQNDGIKVLINFIESFHHLTPAANLSAEGISSGSLVDPSTQSSFTFSCWYRPLCTARDIKSRALFSVSYPATEGDIVGQMKFIELWTQNFSNKETVLILSVPQIEKVPCKKTITDHVISHQIAPAQYRDKVISTPYIEYEERDVSAILSLEDKIQLFNSSMASPTIITPYSFKKHVPTRPGHAFIAALNDQNGLIFKTEPVTKYRQTIIQEKVSDQKIVELKTPVQKDITVSVNSLKHLVMPMPALPNEDWIHVLFSVDARTKIGKVYGNGKLLLELTNPHFVSLNRNCSLKIPQQPAEIAQLHFCDGRLLEPNEFGCFNSQNVWVPKKYFGDRGPHGFYYQ